MQDDNADNVVVGELRRRATELQQFNDDACRVAARIVAWAAGPDGRPLRARMLAFRDRQAIAPTWMQAVEAAEKAEGFDQLDADRWDGQRYEAMLDRVGRKWEAEVVSDGCGKPANIDVAEYIDRLAHWIALTSLPSSRSELLERVQARALELAGLLEEDSSIWPPAIEFFEPEHRPVLIEGAPLNAYRSFVSDRLRAQQVAPLLRNLCQQAGRQARLDALNPEVKDVPRPTARGALERLMARRIHAWLAERCPGGSAKGVFRLIAGLVNASRPPRDRREQVGEDEVKEWLRGPRKRLRTPGARL